MNGKPDCILLSSFVLLFISFILNFISFLTPYWMEAYPVTKTINEFQNMGLWMFCFNDYRFEQDVEGYHLDGCYMAYKGRGWDMRFWATPAWFVACDIFACSTVLFTFLPLLLTSLLVMRCVPYPRLRSGLMQTALISTAWAALSELLVIALFSAYAGHRDYMPRPNWNFFSWSFGLAILSWLSALVALGPLVGLVQRFKEQNRKWLKSQGDRMSADNRAYSSTSVPSLHAPGYVPSPHAPKPKQQKTPVGTSGIPSIYIDGLTDNEIL